MEYKSQGDYEFNHMVIIKEAFTNLVQTTAEDRAEVMNITNANAMISTQLVEYENRLDLKGADILAITKNIDNLQSEVNNLKARSQNQNIQDIPYLTPLTFRVTNIYW